MLTNCQYLRSRLLAELRSWVHSPNLVTISHHRRAASRLPAAFPTQTMNLGVDKGCEDRWRIEHEERQGAAKTPITSHQSIVAARTEKLSSPEKTSQSFFPSGLIHLVGKLLDSPGPMSQRLVEKVSVPGPQGSGAS